MVDQQNDKSAVQRLLDRFYWSRKAFVSFLAYCSLRIYGLEVSFESVWGGTYSTRTHTDRKLEEAKDLPGIQAAAKECLHNAKSRRKVITDKCKTLLTLSSLLLGLVGVLLPGSSSFSAIWTQILFSLAVILLMNAVMLLLVFFDVGTETELSLEQDDVELDSENFGKNLVNLYLRCQIALDNRTDYLVNVYQTARFFFLVAFTIVACLFSASFFTASRTDQTEKVVQELRSDPKLIELLRGPKGNNGNKGERGRDGTVDEDQIIDRLMRDSRMKMLLDQASEQASEPQSGDEGKDKRNK